MPLDQPPAIIQSIPDGKDFHVTGPQFFQLYGRGGVLLVAVNMDDGSITFGPTYTPDAAAKVFWDSIATNYQRCAK